jgi:hypothetical protein
MDGKDGMTQVYREMVLWLISFYWPLLSDGEMHHPCIIKWQRLNTVQNQITLNNNILIKNKVAAFIITGGQDNINPLQVN